MAKKNKNICESCRWGFDNWCASFGGCYECPRNIPNGSYVQKCKCLLVKDGEPCADYEKYKGRVETQDKPSADVVKVRYARWEKVSDKFPRYACTDCRHLFNNKGYKYCPNCGAKMDGGENNG